MRTFFLLVFFSLYIHTTAQNWISVGGGVNNQVRSFYVDSLTNNLITTGKFTEAGGLSTKSIATFDGTNWDSLSSFMISSGQDVWSIARYNGDLYATGPFFGGWQQYFCKWNGNYWDSIVAMGTNVISGLKVHNNELVAFGTFDSIPGELQSNMIAKWNGVSWSSFDSTKWFGYEIANVLEYQGDLYAVGNFENYDQSISKIARWDGNTWHPVGGGFYGGICTINTAIVYNGELIVGGLFTTSDGNPGEHIARWNGSTWSDVGGGMGSIPYPQVKALVVKDGYLYAGGVFSTAGGVNAERFARWDGTNWCGFGDVFGNTTITNIAVYNNEIYIATGLTINGDTVRYIAKWLEPPADSCGNTTGVNELEINNGLSVYPNPATNSVTFELTTNFSGGTLRLYDQLGQMVLSNELLYNLTEIDLSGLASGVYFYHLMENGIMRNNGKLIVVH